MATSAPDAAAAPSETYKASCHCKAFQFTITTTPPISDPSTTVMSCNCSICVRNGYLFLYVADPSVVFQQGKLEDFKAYFFGTKRMAHYFCATCGASCMARTIDPTFFGGMTAVNARMLEDVDPMTIAVKPGDGKNWNP